MPSAPTLFISRTKPAAAPQFLSDTCGSLGLGNRPTKPEHLAWQSLHPGNCDDLKTFLGHFPTSPLADHHVTETPVWTPVTHQLVLHQSPSDNDTSSTSPTLPQAKADALTRAQPNAVNLCNGFAATSRYHLKSAPINVQQWNCEKIGSGFSCGFDGQAFCQLEERSTKSDEICGK